MTKLATIGDNQPPDPIDEALAPYGDYISEAETWLDGATVENEGQMKAVDALTAEIKSAIKAVKAGEESAAKPIYDQWKAEKARWQPTLEDLERIKKGLVAAVSGFKAKLAAEKEAERKAAFAEAERKRKDAEEAAKTADASNIEAQREAAAKLAEAQEADKAARQSETVKGIRKVTKYEITDHRALLHYIARAAREDITAFVEEWARRHHKEFANADGLRVWIEKETF